MAIFHLPIRPSSVLLPVLFALSSAVSAVPVTDNLDIGGAVRTRFDHDPDRDIEKFGIDTAMLRVTYTSDSWIGAALIDPNYLST